MKLTRIIKEPAIRRNEILAAAQRLVYTRGYEQMTIQDILDDLQISKGAFYHYFDSKQSLLEALIDQISQQMEAVLLPIVQDPTLPFIEKFSRLNDRALSWKAAKKEMLLNLARTLYVDSNTIVRQKMVASAIAHFSSIYASMFRQGVEEGVLDVEFPEETAAIYLALLPNIGESIISLLVSDQPPDVIKPRLEGMVKAYNKAIERLLGASPGSIRMIDAQALDG